MDEVRVSYGGVPYNALVVTFGGGDTPAAGAAGTSLNPLVFTGPTGASSNQVQGNVANAATDSGNPVKVGGKANGAAPTAVTSGQRVDAWYDLRGGQMVSLENGGVLSDFLSGAADGVSASFNGYSFVGRNYNFNGTTWDRQRGDTNGAYSVSKGSGSMATAQVSVATTATLIAAARAGRGAITITNVTGAQQVYVGNSGVTTATGQLLPAAIGASITIPFNGAVYGIAVTAAQTVSVMEVY